MSSEPNALALLAQYSSEESDSEEERPKFSKPLPIPSILRELYKEEIDEDNPPDDPALHDGRTRNFPHVRGNWSTFVYIAYEYNSSLQALLDFVLNICKPFVDLKQVEDFHISLTRTVILQYHWIDTLINDFKNSLSQVSSFQISFSSFEVYCNDNKTRTFLGLRILLGQEQLLNCVKLLNECLSSFKLAPFYEEASFHMSIAWCPGDRSEELKAKLLQLNSKLQSVLAEEPHNFEAVINCILCKAGNKIFRFYLN